MSTLRCLRVMSSGITHPFGWLSQSPGYVSDSLLTRSPLCIAAPCDLHVLATPPAFRLSQDQTLQLNFLASGHPHARRALRQGPGLTVSDPTFVLETSLSNRDGQDCSIAGVTAPSSARATGSARQARPATEVAGLPCRVQGSNIFLLAYSTE